MLRSRFSTALRRRARVLVFTLAIVCIAIVGLLSGPATQAPVSFAERQRASSQAKDRQQLSKFLEILSQRPKPSSAPNPDLELSEGSDADPEKDSGIDQIPSVPPTLQDPVDLDDFSEDNDDYSLAEDEGLYGDDESGLGLGLGSSHQYRSDGLLEVNPDGPHPIYELVNMAEVRWSEKLRKASKTLAAAVHEYRRRYHRDPPRGFDHWWDYVQAHNVQLPDEYDQIYRDVEPYWGIEPKLLQKIQFEWEGHGDSFTIGKIREEDVISVLNYTLPEDNVQLFLGWGAKPQMDLMRDVYKYIPPFRATFSPHDNPNQIADYTWRTMAIAAARNGTTIGPDDIPRSERIDWQGTCAPDSPLALNNPVYGTTPPPKKKTFIYDFRTTMDPCIHPENLLLHGNFISHRDPVVPNRFPAPQFSNCATLSHADLRATSMGQTSEFSLANEDLRWEDRNDDRLLWRGSPTGMWHEEGYTWRNSHRIRLVNLTRSTIRSDEDAASARREMLHYLAPTSSPFQRVGEPVAVPLRGANLALVDIAFASTFTGCGGTVCDIFERELRWAPQMNQVEQGKYRYIMDVDGNGWSARFRRLMGSHALVFKASHFLEWWYDRSEPWVHYVPVQLDFTDLHDSLVFFAGDLNGEGSHEEMGKKIALAGRDWARSYWREEDVTAYMFRLFLEYARVMSIDRDSMSFHLPGESVPPSS